MVKIMKRRQNKFFAATAGACLLAALLLLAELLSPSSARALPKGPEIGSIPRSESAPQTSPRSPGAQTGGSAGRSEQSPSGKIPNVPFGGRILFVRPCNTGLLLTIGLPRGGEYMLMPFSRVYLYGVFSPGSWTLGLAGPTPVVCVVGKFPVGAGLPILMVGTSAGG